MLGGQRERPFLSCHFIPTQPKPSSATVNEEDDNPVQPIFFLTLNGPQRRFLIIPLCVQDEDVEVAKVVLKL